VGLSLVLSARVDPLRHVGVVERQGHLVAADPEPVGRGQRPTTDPVAVDERAVGAVEVGDHEQAVDELQAGVAAGE
jgi:hypothetical protein